MIFRAFDRQIDFLKSCKRVLGAFAGKRGGKTEVGAIRSVKYSREQIKFKPNGIDPYTGIIVAPTGDMLRRLSLQKFLAYSRPFVLDHHKTHQEVRYKNGSIIYGISADRPARMEGIKANWVWIDEVFQVGRQIFLEAQARVADTEGDIWCTGSLGVQYANPKAHWCYEDFKLKPDEDTDCFEWSTAHNPYFSRRELERLKRKLDPKTYRQLFTIDWNAPATNAVYEEFDEENLVYNYLYNPNLETIVCIDWGWAHQMAVGFFQYDPKKKQVVLFDEIVGSKITLEALWAQIKAKGYRLDKWFCDIAGNQEREQTGYSNVQWFRKNHGVTFRYRSKAINYGVALTRTFIKNGAGERSFKIDERKCQKSVDGMRSYRYPEKDGMVLNENPIKKDDDCADMIRYYFVNRFDPDTQGDTIETFSRWGLG